MYILCEARTNKEIEIEMNKKVKEDLKLQAELQV